MPKLKKLKVPKVHRTQAEVIDSLTRQSTDALLNIENQDADALLLHYEKAQKDIIGYLNDVFQEMFDSGEGWRLDYMEVTGRSKSLLDEINARISNLSQVSSEQIEMANVRQYQNSVFHSTYMVDQASPFDVPVSMPTIPTEAVRALVNTPFEGAMFSQRIGIINDAMASDIRDQLMQSMINGESMRDASLRVKDVIGASTEDGYANRALTIARSEIMRAQNIGRKSVYMHNEDLMAGTPIWLATPDGRVCPWCLRRDGKSEAEIKRTKVGDDPHGNKSFPPLHPNCRCTLLPQLKTWRDMGIDMPEDFADDERGMRNPKTGKWEIQPVQTFEKWKGEYIGAVRKQGWEIY